MTWAALEPKPRGGVHLCKRFARNSCGRVRDVQVTSANGKKSFAGFPLFPGQRRLIELDWDGSSAPEHIQLDFDHFKKESDLKAPSSGQ